MRAFAAMVSLALLGTSLGIHHGAYVDPNHYEAPDSFAGTRFIGMKEGHAMTMVGTDDGDDWWLVSGTCSGVLMNNLTFDFSGKGGPSSFSGIAVDLDDGTNEIRWEDGNVWKHVAAPSVWPRPRSRSKVNKAEKRAAALEAA